MRYLVAALIRLYQKVSRLTPAVMHRLQFCGLVWCGAAFSPCAVCCAVTRGIPAALTTFRNLWNRPGLFSGAMCGH